VLAHFCSNFGFNILLLWLPTYLDKTFSLTLARIGALSIIPWVATFAASNAGGWAADTMRRRGVRVELIRKLMQGLAFLGGGLPLLAIPHAATPGAAIALASISAACSGGGYRGVRRESS